MARSKYTEVELGMIADISGNLKQILHLKGVSQTDLSNKTKLPTSTISDYVNGKTLIPPGNLQKIADSLNVLKSEINSSFKKAPSYKSIPLIDRVCAGEGLLAEQNVEGYIHYPFQDCRQPDYALRVKYDSMVGAGIEYGDIVFMRYAQWADYNGQIVAALINNDKEGTLKRIIWSEGSPQIKLVPENSNLKVIEVLPNQVQVFGVYMGHFRPENHQENS